MTWRSVALWLVLATCPVWSQAQEASAPLSRAASATAGQPSSGRQGCCNEEEGSVKLMLAALGPIVVVLLTGALAYWQYRRQSNDQRETTVRAVFGDLANAFEHYTYSRYEVPRSKDLEELLIRLRWSQFGEVKSAKGIEKLGNLRAGEIRLLLQLVLRIRNTDQMLDHFLSQERPLTSGELDMTRERMTYCLRTAFQVMHSIALDRPELRVAADQLKKQLKDYFDADDLRAFSATSSS